LKKTEKLFGLGSNDAGGSLVSLIATFLYYYDIENLQHNFILAATAEEEISGHNGIEALLPTIRKDRLCNRWRTNTNANGCRRKRIDGIGLHC
jgi:acetylornithine deacetylase/succinyl-diaminopimelate desuccinylase-like protein